ncbi:hypothetical protein HYE67_002310 [Fusarium culmorum]|uniref:Uncharacterized protein n=1 Tax=Fusarium culmorum TaxID=5516 RepID=A0A2T4GTS1_FUSCU|nr:hypothetical protein FCULG_00006526 [Fusarium culmorum]QPC60079.1 hypothetical protein HYE67_002310 [Fusarium culmorum]
MARALSPIDESPVTSKPNAPYLLVREASKVRIRGPVKPRNESTTLMSMSMGRQSNEPIYTGTRPTVTPHLVRECPRSAAQSRPILIQAR